MNQWKFSSQSFVFQKDNFSFDLCMYQFPVERKGKKQKVPKCGAYQNPQMGYPVTQILLEMVNLHVIMSELQRGKHNS